MGLDASDQGWHRVESRNRCVPQGFPEALVAPPDGTRTTDFAVLLPAEHRRGFNTNDLRTVGQGFCCTTQFSSHVGARSSLAHVLIIAAFNHASGTGPGFVPRDIGVFRRG